MRKAPFSVVPGVTGAKVRFRFCRICKQATPLSLVRIGKKGYREATTNTTGNKIEFCVFRVFLYSFRQIG